MGDGPEWADGNRTDGARTTGPAMLDELEEDAACWMRSSSACITADVDRRRCPANVPLSRWRGFAAAPHRGDATSKAVPIGFSGVLGRWHNVVNHGPTLRVFGRGYLA